MGTWNGFRGPYSGGSKVPTRAPVVNAKVRMARPRMASLWLVRDLVDALQMRLTSVYSNSKYFFLRSGGIRVKGLSFSSYWDNRVGQRPKKVKSFFVSAKYLLKVFTNISFPRNVRM